MAQFESWVDVDLDKKPPVREVKDFYTNDKQANKLGVTVHRGGSTVTLGGTVEVVAIRNDGTTYSMSGEKSGNQAWGELDEHFYLVPGPIDIAIRNIDGQQKTVLAGFHGYVRHSTTDIVVTTEEVVHSIDELSAKIEEADQASNRANEAAELIEDITVEAHAVSGETPTVTKTTVDDHYNFDFGLVPARQTSVDTAYAQTTSGTTVPSSWSPNRPTTVPGQYLWTRLTRHWNNSADTVEYTAAYQGLNGTGAVNSVQGVSPDSNGNVTLPTDATPTTGSTNFMTSGAIKNALIDAAGIVDLVYPVGAIYISANSVDPGTLFSGTTWEQITDAFLLAGGGDYTIGATGGEAEHEITIAEMPSHTHGWKGRQASSLSSGSTPVALFGSDSADDQIALGRGPQAAGGSEPMSLMPPYLAVNIWKRTA